MIPMSIKTCRCYNLCRPGAASRLGRPHVVGHDDDVQARWDRKCPLAAGRRRAARWSWATCSRQRAEPRLKKFAKAKSPQVAQKLPVLPAWACPLSHRASRRPGMRLVDGAGNAGWPMSQLAAADTPSDPKRRYFAVLHNDPYDVVA
jgi:hypothetical protein